MSIISRAELDRWLDNEDSGKTKGWGVAESLTQKLEGVFVGYRGEVHKVVGVTRVDRDVKLTLIDDDGEFKLAQLLDPELLLSIPPDGFYQHPDVGVCRLQRRTLRQWRMGLCTSTRTLLATKHACAPSLFDVTDWGRKPAECVLYPQYGAGFFPDVTALSLHYMIAGKAVYHRDVGLVGSCSKDIITLDGGFFFLKEELTEAAGDGYHIRVI